MYEKPKDGLFKIIFNWIIQSTTDINNVGMYFKLKM